jgi:hypothetical protein
MSRFSGAQGKGAQRRAKEVRRIEALERSERGAKAEPKKDAK